MAKRLLLDELVQQYPEYSRKELHAMVLCGEVCVSGECLKDPKVRVKAGTRVSLTPRRFVSRGGEKLEAALEAWKLPVAGKVFLDAGASAGGFTDCLLRHGAAQVHAVDVGYNQLDYRLRQDPRVLVHERTNITSIETLDPPADAAVADLSFRSLAGVAARLLGLARDGWCVCLVKPQFEWREPDADFTGVVQDSTRIAAIVRETLERLWSEGAYTERLMASPISGRRGNREFLALLRREPTRRLDDVLAG
jgi:23S rRNA (cytidine1920-2'-O)/16S rRNA (cytidine1409-2'-O)-methyltransferase